MMNDELHFMRSMIVEQSAKLTDAVASEHAVVFPRLHEIKTDNIESGTRIQWRYEENGKPCCKVMRAAVTMQNWPQNYPDQAPTLWEDLPYKDGIRIIPEVITEGTRFGYLEKGWWKGELYISKLETNTWTPESFPEGWKKVEVQK